MPKIINDFTIHLSDPKIQPEEMQDYLEKTFGDRDGLDGNTRTWYLGRNYSRPFNESHIEITFYIPWNSKHTLMQFKYPFTIINENSTEWHEVNNEHFNNLFEI
jgi:hypothetical protein